MSDCQAIFCVKEANQPCPNGPRGMKKAATHNATRRRNFRPQNLLRYKIKSFNSTLNTYW